jgi:single-stranded-DNA-specific exonuclease
VVADVVPLREENRILVRHGLRRLLVSPLPGLQALYRAAGLEEGGDLRAADIAFRIAPRLNAAGRLGSARRVIELLTTTRAEVAADLARFLEDENLKRQTLEHSMVDEARQQIEDEDLGEDAALVLARAGWHPGIIGIVAGRLADQYARPTILIALPPESQAGPGVGSGRSVPGFALNEALKVCGDLLRSHGGHPAAAGLRIDPGHIDAFRERFCRLAAEQFPAGPKSPVLVLDAEAPLAALTPGLVRALDRLEPYGADNRRPLFLAGDLQVVGEPRKVGKTERHLSFQVRQNDLTLKAIAFNMAGRTEELLSQGGQCCLAFTPKLNVWRGRVSVDLEAADFQSGPVARLG